MKILYKFVGFVESLICFVRFKTNKIPSCFFIVWKCHCGLRMNVICGMISENRLSLINIPKSVKLNLCT